MTGISLKLAAFVDLVESIAPLFEFFCLSNPDYKLPGLFFSLEVGSDPFALLNGLNHMHILLYLLVFLEHFLPEELSLLFILEVDLIFELLCTLIYIKGVEFLIFRQYLGPLLLIGLSWVGTDGLLLEALLEECTVHVALGCRVIHQALCTLLGLLTRLLQ